MNIRYLDPLSRGWERMKKALFRPFDMKKWFLVGFTAFLSTMTDFHGGGNGKTGWHGPANMETFMTFPERAREWLMDNPGWAAFILVASVAIVILIVVLTWVSSRGKFMFLDNVIHDRALVAQPWSEYRAEGNSLFLWRLVFGLVTIAVLLFYVLACFTSLHARYERFGDAATLIGPLILMALGFFAIMILVGFISLFLTDFVVPVMYRFRVSAMRAWGIFLSLFSLYPMQFIGFALLMLLLIIILVVGIVLVGLMTCCIGFLILAIPYINAVILLPVLYTFRAFSVEFLEQFGSDYHLFPRSAPVQTTESGQSS
jgi:hypothetical protein